MSVVTVRPSGSSALTGTAVTGAASVHAALANSPADDTSYVRMSAISSMTLTFPAPTPDATGRLAWVRFRLRCKRAPVAARTTNPELKASLDGTGAMGTLGHPHGIDMDTSFEVQWGLPQTINPPGPYPMRGRRMLSDPTNLSMVLSRRDQIPAGYVTGSDELALYVYEVYVDTIYADRPTVRVARPVSGTTLTTDNTPRVGWVPSLDPEGGVQDAFQVKLFTNAQYTAGGFDVTDSTATFDSQITDGAARAHDTEEQIDNATYRAYVRVAQLISGSRWWSDWENATDPVPYSQFTLTTGKPNPPTFTLTPQASLGRISIAITSGGGGGGALTAHYFQIQSSEDGGDTYQWLRTPYEKGIVDVGAPATVLDTEPRNGELMYYRVRSIYHPSSLDPPLVDEPGAGNVYSAFAAAQSATMSSQDWWLKHPFNRPLSLAITPRGQPSRQRSARQGIFQPLGRADAVVITDTYTPFTGSLVLRCDSDTERTSLKDLINEGDPILVQAPVNTQYWHDIWVVINEQSSERVQDTAWGTKTWETLTWTQVQRPEGKYWFS